MRPQVLLNTSEPRFQMRAYRPHDNRLYVNLGDVVAWLEGERLPDTAKQLREAGAELSKPAPKPAPMMEPDVPEVAEPMPEVAVDANRPVVEAPR